MNIYYMRFAVSPTDSNAFINKVQAVRVSCWIRHFDSISAYTPAVFYIKKYNWKIENVIDQPAAVTSEDFNGKDVGLENYKIAVKEGSSYVYVGETNDDELAEGSHHKMTSSHAFDMQSYLSESKKNKNRGRCLHFDSGERCNKIINAHSVQKNGMLSKIAENGKVYSLSMNIGDLDKNNGLVSFKKNGISKFSTFKGFCKDHDNFLFEQIDNFLFVPTHEQAFLYAYRSLCKELFLKENSLRLFAQQSDISTNNEAHDEFFSTSLEGTKASYEDLQLHKRMYDQVLKNKSFEEIEYCAFISTTDLFTAYSGVMYPEYDFNGMLLQNLCDDDQQLDLIAHYSAPTAHGWAHVFTWHKSSSSTSRRFMSSLAARMHHGGDIGDLLFRFVILNCENIAFSPSWWEKLSKKEIAEIIEGASCMVDPFVIINPYYLTKGLSGVSNWEFSHVYSEFDLQDSDCE